MRNPSKSNQEAKALDRFKRSDTDGATALNLKPGRRRLDVIGSRSFVPESWRRKSGPAASLVESFYHAFHGVVHGLKEQRNLRIHFSLALAASVLGLALKIDLVSWMALTIVISLVIACEFINTALEHLVDISANNQYLFSARLAKDTAAAAVLAVSVAALATGLMVFVPKLLLLIEF